jgi:hypothetical protein
MQPAVHTAGAMAKQHTSQEVHDLVLLVFEHDDSVVKHPYQVARADLLFLLRRTM